ncbi:MAG: protein kinase [Gimesia sp.]|nr:protein kinase [Gimesia sp.]
MNTEQKPDPPENDQLLQVSDSAQGMPADFETVSDSLNPDSSLGNTVKMTGLSTQFQAGQKLGKYEILAKLGQGGMGTVFLGFDPMIEREVAIKVLPTEIATDPIILDRFLAEAKAIGKLSHPHVVSVFDIGQHENLYYIVMELLKGGSLAELIIKEGALPWEEASRMIAEAADGLAAAHAAGLVHRDIKPDNLMLTQDRSVKVVDFGLSKLLDAANDTRDAKTKVGQILGTPQFMSPEQFQGQDLDSRSDIYSLGATYYSLLTGKLPYEKCRSISQVMYAHLEQVPPDPSKIISPLPNMCKMIIDHAMAKSSKSRYQDMQLMSLDLQSLRDNSSENPTVIINKEQSEEYRPLNSVVIVEPSKMQSMILMDALTKSGITTIHVCRTVAAALDQIDIDIPDLVITSLQLPDKNGIELISDLRQNPLLQKTMLILNSTDFAIEQLVEADQCGPVALVSKKTKATEILQAIHACTFFEIPHNLLLNSIQPAGIRTLIVSDSERIPKSIANQIRRLELVDVQVTSFGEMASGSFSADSYDLMLVLRMAGDVAQDSLLYANLLSQNQIDPKVEAAVQVNREKMTLRAVHQHGFTAITSCPFSDTRLKRLLQLCY